MPISNEEWASISNMINRSIETSIGRSRDYFMIGTVKKVDKENKLIYVKELPGIKIPIFAFDYRVIYFDESPRGANLGSYQVYKKKAEATVLLPEIKDEVLIIKEMGNDLMPRCVGVLRSSKWIEELEDT